MRMTATIPLLVGILTIMIRQEFDSGDLVKLVGPIGAAGETGMVLESKRIHDLPSTQEYQWHRDEYRCRIKLVTGECDWVRAKFLRILSRAKREGLIC